MWMNKLIKTVLAIMLMSAIAVMVQGCSTQELSDVEYVNRAKDLRDKGELRGAIVELKNALKQNPNSAEARWLLGQVHVDVGNGFAAEKELLKARELGVVDDSVMPLLLKALLYQQNYERLLEMGISSVLDKNAAAEVYASRGMAYLALRDLDKAKEELELSTNKNVNSLHGLVANARLAAAIKDYPAARVLLDKALKIKDTYAPAWSALGDLLQIQKDVDGAIAAYSGAIEHRFDNSSDLLKRSMLLIEQEAYDKANNDLLALKKRFPKHPGVNYVQGVLLFYQEKYSEASSALELAYKGDVGEVLAMYYLGATQFMLGNREQAKTYISQFVAAAPLHIAGRRLLAVISLQDQDYSAAEKLVRPIVKAMPDDVFSMNVLANALNGKGETKEALQLLEQVVALKPDSASAYTRMSAGLSAQGEIEKSRDALRAAIELDPEFQQADVMLVLSHLRAGELNLARQSAEEFVKRHPDSALAHNVLGSVFMAMKEEDKAKAVLHKALEVAPGDPAAASSLAMMALAEDDVDGAQGYYKKILDVHPGHLHTLLKLAALEDKQGHYDKALSVLQRAGDSNPDAVEPKVALAQAYLARGEADQARLVISKVSSENKRDPYVLGVVGGIHMATGEFDSAKLVFRQLVEVAPDQAQGHFLLAQAYDALGVYDAAVSELKTAVRLVPEHKLARSLLVKVLVKTGDVKEAKQQLALLKTEGISDSAELFMLDGAVNHALGDSTQALMMYKKAFELAPNEKQLLVLAKYQWSQGMQDESISLLENWRKDNAVGVEVLLVLANDYIGVGRQDEAVQQYKEVLKLSGDNLTALNNLAWYLRASDSDQALSFAEKAYELAPHSVTVMDTLAMILFDKGEANRAKRVIERALARYPDDPSLHFHNAMILEKTDGNQAAKDVLEQLLDQNKEFREREQAADMLKRLKGG